MAIKIGGTTVIDDSRNLVNVTGFKTINSTPILGTGDIAATTLNTVSTTPQFTAYTPTPVQYVALLVQPPYPLSPGPLTTYTGSSDTTGSGMHRVLDLLPEPPNDALLKSYDASVSVSTSTIPGPPDQGPSGTNYQYLLRLRSEYRSVT